MATWGLAILAVGLGAVIGGMYGRAVMRGGRRSDRSTNLGGGWLGSTWALRLGLVAVAVGAVVLAVGLLTDARS